MILKLRQSTLERIVGSLCQTDQSGGDNETEELSVQDDEGHDGMADHDDKEEQAKLLALTELVTTHCQFHQPSESDGDQEASLVRPS